MLGAEVRVLGPVEVVAAGLAVPLPAKQARLLAALVVAGGRTRDADQLVEALWDGSPPASARNLVHVYVSQLRKALPGGIEIVTRGHAYALELEAGVLDALRFEQLVRESAAAHRDGNAALAASLAEQGLALWRARAYGDLADEELARVESARLEELRLVAIEQRLAARLDLGEHAELLGEALSLVDEHPYRERLHALAMLALYRSGRQQEALEHYARVRDHLSDELGLEPGLELRDLQRRILRQDPELTSDSRPAARSSGSLPIPPNPLLGRERELDELNALLARRDARLIVLTGAGGSGKTRLALEAARQAAGSYANGAGLVELAPLRDPAFVIPTIARRLGIVDADDAPLEALAEALAPQELLLLVDNAEHVRSAASELASLVSKAPRLTLLVTSRAVLHVSGEHVFPVLPLAEEDGVELFVERAKLLEPTFERSLENDGDLREICRRVDGLPLAIEIAAARIRTLPPPLLRERLDERLSVLTGGPRDLPSRQQTLRETIQWSVDLLGGRERDVFARLAVFPSGATLEAAEQVCGADLDTLGVLIDDNLVHRHDVSGEPRFVMLETIREYAIELLGSERGGVELALAEHFAQLVDELRLSDGSEPEWRRAFTRVDAELENVRIALAAAAASDDTDLLLRLSGGLWRYWWVRGPAAEGLEWIERALAGGDGAATVHRARALYGAAGLAWSRRDFERAKEHGRVALAVAVDAGSEWYELCAHTVLGAVASDEADYPTGRYHHQRSLEIKERLGIEPLVEKLNLGEIAHRSGDREAAMALFEEVLASHQRDENHAGMGFVLLNLGSVRHGLADYRAARRDFERARECFEAVGHRQQASFALQGLAACEASEANFTEAARLLGRARRELDEIDARWDAFAPDTIAAAEAATRTALGDAEFEAAFTRPEEA